MAHKYLYLYENNDKVLLEAKRLDVMEGTPKSEICFWLLIDLFEGTCEPLKFVSMRKNEHAQNQTRTFESGSFVSDESGGVFRDNNGNYQNVYFNTSVGKISESIEKIVSNFFATNYPERTKLSDVPFNKINLEHTLLISAMGSEGKIVDSELQNNGSYLELILWIEWNSGNTSRVIFPDECNKITLKNEPYVYKSVK